jgi:hypothetical protein
MIMATPEMFQREDPDSYRKLPGFDASVIRQQYVGELSSGETQVSLIRSVPGFKWVGSPWHMHHYNFSITYIINGWADFEFEGIGAIRLGAGTIMDQPAMNRHREGDASEDFEGIAFHNPPVFGTTAFMLDEASGTYVPNYIGDIAQDEEFGASLDVVSG